MGTAGTQVSVTWGLLDTSKPWVDDSDNWSASLLSPFPVLVNLPTTITATSTVGSGSSDAVTVVRILPVSIDWPQASVSWSDEIQVGGQGNPDSKVHVSAYQGNILVSGCVAPVEDIPPGESYQWSCNLEGLAAGQDYTLFAHLSGTAGSDNWPWTDPTVPQKPIHIDAIPLAITSPANGGHIDGDDPTNWAVAGTGTPGGQVQVWILPSTNSCGSTSNGNVANASIGPDGQWTTAATFQFSPGQSYTVQACQTVNGEQAPGGTSTFESWPA